jgi:hypothetical protein
MTDVRFRQLAPLDAFTTPLRLYVEAVLVEWHKGCSIGPAGDCEVCTLGALRAIETALHRERTAANFPRLISLDSANQAV